MDDLTIIALLTDAGLEVIEVIDSPAGSCPLCTSVPSAA
jgi:hypothetical protein